MSRVECDKARCSGCLACIVACLDQHYDEADGYAVPARIYEMQKAGTVSRNICDKELSALRGGSLFKSLSLWSSKKRRKRFCNTSQRELQRV